MYHYTDQEREKEPTALPDVEVFHDGPDISEHGGKPRNYDSDGEPISEGFYYAYGFPGCLWDSDPVGPFDSEQEALKEAREAAGF